MKLSRIQIILVLLLMPTLCFSKNFPDLGGILDFSKPKKIHDELFILTNPKSGSHLLLYSIMKITQRPLRGRVPIWHFKNDPPFFEPENIMNYPLDFTKPTMYWGHEYHLLKPLNHSQNKLIFILRNYKENLSSLLTLNHKHDQEPIDLADLFLNEVLNEGMVFKEYIIRLKLFDEWDPNYRCLVLFEHLTHHPEIFVPQVISFIDDDSEYYEFIEHYDDFKIELLEKYNLYDNRTGSGSNNRFFSEKIPLEVRQSADRYIQEHYPDLWKRYLIRFSE